MKTVDPPDRLVAAAARSGWKGRTEEQTTAAAEWEAFLWVLECLRTEDIGVGK
jgi:hypothetical protein